MTSIERIIESNMLMPSNRSYFRAPNRELRRFGHNHIVCFLYKIKSPHVKLNFSFASNEDIFPKIQFKLVKLTSGRVDLPDGPIPTTIEAISSSKRDFLDSLRANGGASFLGVEDAVESAISGFFPSLKQDVIFNLDLFV